MIFLKTFGHVFLLTLELDKLDKAKEIVKLN